MCTSHCTCASGGCKRLAAGYAGLFDVFLRDPKVHLSPKLLGHADIKLTLGTYSHFLPSMGDQTAAIKIALG
jgi:hypothetical protein